MRFGHAAELGFPVAVEDDPVDVAAVGASVSQRSVLRGVEADVARGAGRDCRDRAAP